MPSAASRIESILQGQPAAVRAKIREEMLIDASRTDLGAHGMYLFDGPNSPHRPAPHHEEWIEALNDPTVRRLFIACPRGHAKTSWIGNAYPNWELGRNRNLRIGYVSATEGQAESISLVNKALVDGNPKYRQIFPNVIPDLTKKWTNTNWYVQRDHLLTHPTFFATGTEGPVLGKRFDILVLDDVCDQRNMASPILRKKVMDWVEATLAPCLTDSYVAGVKTTPRIVIICTRWHEEDIFKWAKDYGGFEFIIQPALGHWEVKRGIITIPDTERGQFESTKVLHNNPLPAPLADAHAALAGYTEIYESPEEPPEPLDITHRQLDNGELEPLVPNSSHKVFGQQGNSATGHLGNRELIRAAVPIYKGYKEIGEEVIEGLGAGVVAKMYEEQENGEEQEKEEDKGPWEGRMALLEHGSALWPEKDTREKHLKDYTRNKTLFWKMSMQNPSSPAGNIFHRSWWGFYNKAATIFNDGDVLAVIFSWDTAFTKNSESDFSVGYSMVLTKDGNIFITRENCGQYSFPELKKAMKRFYFTDPIRAQCSRPGRQPIDTAIVIEQKGSGISVYQSLQVESIIPLFPSPADQDKETRANAVSWIVESGRVFLPDDEDDAEWVAAFIEQLAEFPNAKKDDKVDACVHGLAFLISQKLQEEEDQLVNSLEDVHLSNNPYDEDGIDGLPEVETDPLRLMDNSPFALILPDPASDMVDLSDPFA